MDAKALRIGNLIKYTDYPNLKDDLLGKVICVTGDDISFMSNCNVAYLEPIKLTEDLLIKLGFNKDGRVIKTYAMIGNEINFKILVNTENEFYFYPSVAIKWSVRLKYVHQLQNLYFALTGEELDVTNIK